jgi:uncharacterized protein (TIGR00251 family)
MRDFKLHSGKAGAALTLRVTPRARKTGFAGVLEDGILRVRVAAPPVEGKANAELLTFLARVLGVRKNRLEIIAGQRGLDKIVSVLDLSAEEVQSRIQSWLSSQEQE